MMDDLFRGVPPDWLEPFYLEEARRSVSAPHEALQRYLRETSVTGMLSDVLIPGVSLQSYCRRREHENDQPIIQAAIALDRRQVGRDAASRQHEQKRQWYESAVAQARIEWEHGSTLRHDQMATKLLESAPPATKISRPSLIQQLAALLREIDKPHLIRGLEK